MPGHHVNNLEMHAEKNEIDNNNRVAKTNILYSCAYANNKV